MIDIFTGFIIMITNTVKGVSGDPSTEENMPIHTHINNQLEISEEIYLLMKEYKWKTLAL